MMSLRPELNTQQRAAVASPEPALVVRASAGAGKTLVLVSRYLKHVVEDGCRPDQILTITFTRKAAAEMKGRIVASLRDLGLFNEAQVAETGPIQTIHSFCERLLRENAIVAGIDPDFSVLDEAACARLFEDSIRFAIAAASEEEEKLLELLAGRRRQGVASPHAVLEEAVRKALRDLRGSGLSPDQVLNAHSDPVLLVQSWQAHVLEDLPREIRAEFESQDSSLPFAARLRNAHKSLRRAQPKGLPHPDELEEAEASDRACAEASCAIVSLACRAWAHFDSLLSELRASDFVALEEDAVRLIRDSQQVRERVRRQYRVVLVDEAQDLSPPQYRLLEALEIAMEMRVGDAQQSIYGFRQADVRLFLEIARSRPTVELSKNYRSREGILAFIDTLFGRLWGEAYLPMLPAEDPLAEERGFDGVEVWIQRARAPSEVAAWIEELVSEVGAAREVSVLVRRGSYAIDLLARLEERGVPARIAGGSELYYTRLEVRDLANALQAVENADDDLALLSTLRSPIGGLSLDSIALLALNPPVAAALETFEPPLEEDRERLQRFRAWFERLRGIGDRIGAWEALSSLFAETPYLENLARRTNARQLLANVRKLLRLAAAHPELSPSAYARFLRDVAELRHREGDAPALDDDADIVTIMTLHKAKGLEFPIVVLPDTHYAIAVRRGQVEVDKALGFLTAHFDGRCSFFHDWIAERRKDRERAEELRLLYVGMTRAKNRLCVACDPQARSNSPASIVAQTMGIGDRVPSGVRIREPSAS